MDASRWSVTASLGPGTGAAALLRIVSIVHSRCAALESLTFDSTGRRVVLELRPSVDVETVRLMLLRSVDVLTVTVSPAREAHATAER